METKNPAEINYATYNPRTMSVHDANSLETSMTKFGDISGITSNQQTNNYVTGHQRMRTLQKRFPNRVHIYIEQRFEQPDEYGTTAIGYVSVDDTRLRFAYREVSWSLATEKIVNVAANRIEADWDQQMLAEINAEIASFENGAELLALTGQTEEEINKLLDSVGANGESSAEDEEAPAVDVVTPPVSKLGEIYQLGNHRLMCGSATDKAQVAGLLDGAAINLVMTDPPYGISVVSGSTVGGDKPVTIGTVGADNIVKANKYSEIIGDETTETARDSYILCKAFGVKNYIIWGGNYFTDFLDPKACWVVWDKQNSGNFADVEMAWTSFDTGAKLYHFMWNGLAREGNRQDELESRVHPTQKPVGMQANVLADFSERGNIVLDLFGGSGSCLIACEKMERICYMMELSPAYVDVIRKRYAKYMGQEENWQSATPVIQTVEARDDVTTIS